LRIRHLNRSAMKPIDDLSDDEFAHLVQRAVALPDAPESVVRAAIDLWPVPQRTALKDLARAGVRLVRAVLTFDSWASPAVAMGMRSVASDTRHLLFSAQGRDIDLRISPAADHFALTGQILGPDEAGAVELVTHAEGGLQAQEAHAAPLDAMGEFRLDGVRGGTYQLTLRVGADEIVLPPIVVGERAK
jgi:hypothetical protein